jgi:predicted alpha-1,6-mannanase (GH76 family)
MSAALSLALSFAAQAFWPADADTAFNSYNNAFYVSNSGNAYYKTDSASGGPGWWTLAEEIEMADDARDRNPSTGNTNIVSALCNGFVAQYGTLWTSNTFNDDIAWAVIAFARAYQITGNTAYRDRAKANFDAIYSRGYDSVLGGGMWWNTSKGSKNACVNCPASIGAYLLYQITGDSGYLTKSQNLYNWVHGNLFNATTGQVYDNMSSGGTVTTWVFSYNQGTFIGAANYLGNVSDATLAANCTKNTLCTGGILPDATENSDGGGFNGIFIRWMAKFMKDRSLQSTYQPWLQLNANAAWNSRRTSDNLGWNNWRSSTPTGTRYSWGCSNMPVILQVVPADGEGVMLCQDIDYQGTPSSLIGPGTYNLAQFPGLNVADDSVTSLRVPSGWKATLYQNDNLTGTAWAFTGDTNWVGAANDQATSLKVETTGVIFYQDLNYLGSRGSALAKGTYTMAQLAALGVPNDWATSMRIPAGWTVIMYQNDNLTGTSWTFTSDTNWIGSAANDQMTSCKIQ